MAIATPGVRAVIARTSSHVEDAARLRYAVYIAEQGKPYPDADHARQLWTDVLDSSADIVVVLNHDNLPVGTVRANTFSCDETHRAYGATFGIDEFQDAFLLDEMVVCSRLAVHPAHRNVLVRNALFESIYAHRLTSGTRLCFATCAAVLLRMFRSYGFREYAPTIHDPHVGALHRVVLVLDDVHYLQEIRSPFADLAKAASVVPRGHDTLVGRFAHFASNIRGIA